MTPLRSAALALPVALGLAGPALAETAFRSYPVDRSLGPDDAAVTVIEYGSFTCPHCASFDADSFPLLDRDYIQPDRIRYVFRDAPYDQAGLYAGMLAQCVADREADAEAADARYFAVVHRLFAEQPDWAYTGDALTALGPIAEAEGLPAADFKTCVRDEALQTALVSRSMDGANDYGISGTPTFVVHAGGEVRTLVGNQPLDAFRSLLDPLLKP